MAFFRQCQALAKQFRFELIGEMFGDLYFKCAKACHTNKISYNRRITPGQPLLCVQCHQAQREQIKQSLRDEEQQKQCYFAKMQEECFQKASQAMQEELKNQEEPIMGAKHYQQEQEDCATQEHEVNTKAWIEAEVLLKKEDNQYENLQME